MKNMYRVQRGKDDRPSALMRRTCVAYLLLQVSVSNINQNRAKRGKGAKKTIKRPPRIVARPREGVRSYALPRAI